MAEGKQGERLASEQPGQAAPRCSPVSAFLGGNEIEQQGSVNPIFSTLAPSSQSQQKAQRLEKTPFPRQNQCPVVCCECDAAMTTIHPPSSSLPCLPSSQVHVWAVRLDPHPASLEMGRKPSTSKKERELLLVSVYHMTSSLIMCI